MFPVQVLTFANCHGQLRQNRQLVNGGQYLVQVKIDLIFEISVQ